MTIQLEKEMKSKAGDGRRKKRMQKEKTQNTYGGLVGFQKREAYGENRQAKIPLKQ